MTIDQQGWCVRNHEGKYMTWDGWGRIFWTSNPPGGLYPSAEMALEKMPSDGTVEYWDGTNTSPVQS